VSHKFNAAIQHRDDVSYVKLAGVIDEDNELANIVERIPRGTAVIDLGEIERINSCGVRDWVNWLSRLDSQGTRVVLVECSPAIVAQINLVNNFTGNGVVKSFFVPYFCPECDEEKVLLVETADMGALPHEPPMCRCDECDLVMDFDDMPDSYFAFLSNSRKYAEAEKVNGAIRDLSGQADHPDRGRVRARVSSPAIAPTHKANVPAFGGRQPSQPNRMPAPAYGASLGSGGVAGGTGRPGVPSAGRTQGPMGFAPMSPMSNGNPGFGMLPPGAGMLGSGAGGPAAIAPLAPLGHGMVGASSQRSTRRGNSTIYALVGVLMIAIAVLCYLLLTR
jgi:anti-anti-sigma regulatory factor